MCTDRRTFSPFCLFIHQNKQVAPLLLADLCVLFQAARFVCITFDFMSQWHPLAAGVFCRRQRRSPWHFGIASASERAPCTRKKANNKIRVFTANLSPPLITLFIIHIRSEHQRAVDVGRASVHVQRSLLTLGLVADRETRSLVRLQSSPNFRLPQISNAELFN